MPEKSTVSGGGFFQGEVAEWLYPARDDDRIIPAGHTSKVWLRLWRNKEFSSHGLRTVTPQR